MLSGTWETKDNTKRKHDRLCECGECARGRLPERQTVTNTRIEDGANELTNDHG